MTRHLCASDNPNPSPYSESQPFNQKSTKNDQNEYSDSHFLNMILNQQILANTPNQWDPCHNNTNHRIFHASYERSAYIFNMRAGLGPSKLESEYGLSVNYPTKINNKPNTKATEISTSFSHEDIPLSTI